MTSGIEKIISGIESNSAAEAQRIVEQAFFSAENVEKQGKAQAAAFLKAGKKSADERLTVAKANADSAAALKIRGGALMRRSALINEVIDEAVKRICTLPDGEYFARLLSHVQKNKANAAGVLRLNKADLARDTEGFKNALSALDITLDCSPADIENGFILIYGDIEICATLSSLVREKKDQLIDSVNSILFTE